MRIIKLDAIDSTNTFLKEICSADAIEDFTVVQANSQTNGRGQMGKTWQSNAGENLTFSVYKRINNVSFNNQFYLSIITALALHKTLQFYNLPKLMIKWPNDILSADKKLCGILIENMTKKNTLSSTIIGVGLNINQTKFHALNRATSLKLICGKTFDLDEVLYQFLKHLKAYFLVLEAGVFEALKAEYETKLFRKNKPSTFKNAEGDLFSGFIKGITTNGNLIVLLEDEILEEFSLNEITLMY